MTQKDRDQHFYKTLLAIAAPIALQSLISNFLNMIDVFMISSLSSASIAGVGMANKVFFLLSLFLFGTTSGATVLASQYWGKEDVKNIRRVLGMTLIIGISGSILFMIGAIFFPTFIMKVLMPKEAEAIKEGAKYLRIVGTSYIFTAISVSFGFLLRSTHQVKLPTIISASCILVNTFFNYMLIFGKFGAPELGVSGAAIATVIARIVECITLVTLVYKFKLPLAGKLSEIFDISKAFITHYFKTVTFVILNEVAWSLGIVCYSLIYGRMGETVTASIVVTQTIEQLAWVAFHGLCSACGVVLGNNLGANNLDDALRYSKRVMKIAISISISLGIILFLSAKPIANIFNVEDAVRANIVKCLRVFSVYLPAKSMNALIIVGILRSGGDTLASLIIDLSGVYFIGIPWDYWVPLCLI